MSMILKGSFEGDGYKCFKRNKCLMDWLYSRYHTIK